MKLYINDESFKVDGKEIKIEKIYWLGKDSFIAHTSDGQEYTFGGISDPSVIQFDGLTISYNPDVVPKTPAELDAELQQTNSLLGDTILSGWETQAELDLNEQILGDTILSTWEMDERITEIEEKIGGQEQ